jgi:hypothetical protein
MTDQYDEKAREWLENPDEFFGISEKSDTIRHPDSRAANGGLGMARAKKHRAVRRRDRVKREERIEATPETRAKLTDDPIRKLVSPGPRGERPKLSAGGESAAAEIRAVFLAVVQRLMPGRMKFVDPIQGVDDMPEALARLHRDNYLPWVRRTAPRTVAAVIDLCVDRIEPAGEFAEAAVIAALEDYAKTA